jgi:hypothetical protein
MAHGREQRNKTRALTPVFPIYAILLQLTNDQLLRKPNAAKCISGDKVPEVIATYGYLSL